MGQERRGSQGARTAVAIGLTGSIGAGKSTALRMFADRGVAVLSADALVHEIYERPEVGALIARHFGQGVIAADGSLERARLAEAVRGNSGELRWLEGVTHPLVSEEIARRMEEAPPGGLIVCEVPLMFEAGLDDLFDLVVTVEAAPEVRRKRSTHKFGLEQFGEFEALQASSQRRVAGSDLVFVNDGTLEELRDFVDRVCERARRILAGDSAKGTA